MSVPSLASRDFRLVYMLSIAPVSWILTLPLLVDLTCQRDEEEEHHQGQTERNGET